jgi:hypothetical protein
MLPYQAEGELSPGREVTREEVVIHAEENSQITGPPVQRGKVYVMMAASPTACETIFIFMHPSPRLKPHEVWAHTARQFSALPCPSLFMGIIKDCAKKSSRC